MKKKIAFTLAEVLITLAIIGVVSAIVIPTVVKNYNDKKYNTARLKALKTFGEAGKMASINGEINGQPSARAFVENVLSKYLKVTKVCDKAEECNFPSQIQPSNPDSKKLSSDSIKTWFNLGYDQTYNNWSAKDDASLSVYIMTVDGFSAKLFYNPKCMRNSHENTSQENCTFKECNYYPLDAACMNVVYDMNGIKPPNHVGYDMSFVTTFWSGLNAVSVAPGIIPYSDNMPITWKHRADAIQHCANKGTNKKPYSLPNIDELSSLNLNLWLSSMTAQFVWSSSVVVDRPNIYWRAWGGGSNSQFSSGGYVPWCIQR